LFAPFLNSLADATLLILVPHGRLHRLPLHALNVGGEPLISRQAITYAPSLGVLWTLAQANAPENSVETSLVLSHATSEEEAASFEGEANDVAALLGVRARHHANKTAVVDGAPHARVAHLSCHGYFDRNDPLQSGVVLADGVMTARDWLALMLRTELVTLSACETGIQQIRSGDELQGFGRALLEAGSTGVLLTLWNVASESTVEWMHAFYSQLGATSSKAFPMAHAFQAATMALRDREPDPLFWAPFVLMGRPA
jgi:CHAT domain-containing protein